MTNDLGGRGKVPARGILRRRRQTADPQALADLAEYRRLKALSDAAAPDLLENPAMLARGSAGSGFVMRPHARVIGNKLAELERRSLTSTRYQGLIITTPPQVGKSTLVTEWGAFWWLCLDPTSKIMVACYGDDLAVKRGSNTQNLVRQYGAPYGLELRHGNSAVKDWTVTAGGGMRSVGIQSGSTGFSSNRLVMDDLHKDRADAKSRAKREAVWDWWSSTGSQRLQPNAIVVIVLTRWDPDDIAGRVIGQQGLATEGGRWHLLHIPGYADAKFGEDPLGRRHGEPLPHPKIKITDKRGLRDHWGDKKATMSNRDFYSLIQGDPQPVEGALISEEILESIREWDTTMHSPPVRIAVAVDPSGGGRDTAGIVGGHLGEDGRMWITHDRTDVLDPEEWAREACVLAAEIHAQIIVLEQNYGGKMVRHVVIAMWEKLRAEWLEMNAALEEHGADPLTCPYSSIPPSVERANAKVGKALRAEPIAQQMRMDKVRLASPELLALEREWATWTDGESADSPGRVDASTYLGYWLLTVPGASQVISVAKENRSRTGAPMGGARIQR